MNKVITEALLVQKANINTRPAKYTGISDLPEACYKNGGKGIAISTNEL